MDIGQDPPTPPPREGVSNGPGGWSNGAGRWSNSHCTAPPGPLGMFETLERRPSQRNTFFVRILAPLLLRAPFPSLLLSFRSAAHPWRLFLVCSAHGLNLNGNNNSDS